MSHFCPCCGRLPSQCLKRENESLCAEIKRLEGRVEEVEAGAAAMRDVLIDLRRYAGTKRAPQYTGPAVERCSGESACPCYFHRIDHALANDAGSALLEELLRFRNQEKDSGAVIVAPPPGIGAEHKERAGAEPPAKRGE